MALSLAPSAPSQGVPEAAAEGSGRGTPGLAAERPPAAAEEPASNGGARVLQLCYFTQETCPYGSFCRFAHSVAELGKRANPPAPSGSQAAVVSEALAAQQAAAVPHAQPPPAAPARGVIKDAAAPARVMLKMRLCWYTASGAACPYGMRCTFAHSPEEIGQPVAVVQSGSARRLQGHYKTRLCTFFAQEGTCRAGSACPFAHGEAELRTAAPEAPPVAELATDPQPPQQTTASTKGSWTYSLFDSDPVFSVRQQIEETTSDFQRFALWY